MILFVIGTIIFTLAATALAVVLALWVYNDAKVRSDQNPALWLVLVLATGIIGLIIYMLAGRTNKQIPPPGKYKKLLAITTITFILATGLFTAGIIDFIDGDLGAAASTRIGSFSMSRSQVQNQVWTFRARSANGWERRRPTLNAQQLSSLHVLSDSGQNITLRLEQGNHTTLTDISNFFDGHPDTSPFSPGPLRITLHFEHANNVNIQINWQE